MEKRQAARNRAPAGTGPKQKRRGGRKKGQWELVSSDALPTLRKTQKLSRGAVAQLLGVSSTTIQNWETGRAVPMRTWQARIAELVQTGPVATQAAPRRTAARPSTNGAAADRAGAGSAASAAQLTATGEIMKGFLATTAGGKLKPEELVALTKSLCAALG